MDSVIFFAARPDFENLCGITVSCDEETGRSLFQSHVSKCRELIFTDPNVLGSPACGQGQAFHVVMTQDLYKTGKVQARLKTLGLSHSKAYRVSVPLYQTCLRYTVHAKLAPAWNKVGDWYIKGKDFLVHTGYASAIRMNLSVNKNEIYIALTGTIVRCPPLQVEDLNLSEKEKLDFLRLTDSNTQSVDLEGFRCHVLPSMKQGWLVSLSLNVPPDGPFCSYKDFCRYWKNIYGYRLPRTDETILYCQVSFLSSGQGKKFTYPNVCLRSNPILLTERVDPKPVLKAFLQDLHTRVNTVCGMPLRFAPRIQYPVPSLATCNDVNVHTTGQISLSNKSQKKPTAPYRSAESVSRLLDHHQDRNSSSSVPHVKSHQPHFVKNTNEHMISQSADRHSDSQICKTKEHENKSKELKELSLGIMSENIYSQGDPNSLPVGKPTTTLPSGGTSLNTSICPKVQGDGSVRNPQTSTSTTVYPHVSNGTTGPPKSTSVGSNHQSSASSAPKLVPRFKPKQMLQQSSVQKTYKETGATAGGKLIPLFKQTKKPSSHQQNTIVSRETSCTTAQAPSPARPEAFGLPMRPVFSKKSNGLSQNQKKPESIALQGLSHIEKNAKRKNAFEGEVSKKKAKPQSAEVDVEIMARTNQLNKVNTATLIAWLKEKGVACRSRDKKADLVNKVCQHLHISAAEE